MRKTRICCFCEKWESGGIESFLFSIFSHMNISDMEVDIVVSCLNNSLFTKQLEDIGISFYELSGQQRNILKNHRMFKALLEKRSYDVVHLNIFHGLSLYYAKLAKEAGVPVRIAHSHNTALRPSVGKPLKLLIHKLSKHAWAGCATDIWASSCAAADFIAPHKLLKKGYQFIPNGIDIKRFRFSEQGRIEARCVLGVTDELLVGNVGRLCRQKNQTFLLDVFAELKKKYTRSKLLIVGEGEALEGLKAQAVQSGIKDSVIFYGVTDHVEKLLWALDIFIFPSLFEGLGIAAIEAQAAGLPVLCSENIPEETTLSDRCKCLSLSLGADKWAEKVSELAKDQVRDVPESVFRFDIKSVTEQIRSKYTGEP